MYSHIRPVKSKYLGVLGEVGGRLYRDGRLLYKRSIPYIYSISHMHVLYFTTYFVLFLIAKLH